MNTIYNNKLTIIVLLAIIVGFLSACNNREDFKYNLEDGDYIRAKDAEGVLKTVATQWGISKKRVISSMKDYIQDSTYNDNMLLFHNNGYTRLFSYEFKNDSLFCSLVLMPLIEGGSDIDDILHNYKYLGSLDNSRVFEDSDKNTMIASRQVTIDSICFISVGLMPIHSLLVETLDPIVVSLSKIDDITYNSAKITANITGVTSKVTVGIYYDTDPLIPSSTRKIKSTTSKNDFTILLSSLDINSKYYYQAFAKVDGILYLSDIQSFETERVTAYQIGDLYPSKEQPEGVVFYISNSGINGRIVSFDCNSLYWDTDNIFLQKRGCTNNNDGSINTPKMPSSTSKTLAGPWCTNHGEGWYCPARNELVSLASNISIVNATLAKNGYNEFGGYYWSSTEYDNNKAYIVCLIPYNSTDKSGDYFSVNKGQSYRVCAVKKF